ncbi:ADP-ribosylglycohydrolase [Candidatus Bathyarchaeota archaeon RBG_13_52_12]|nr:MAG: ADP-ribosylglycohydrolase [Candidatus Bathyarchaeota archaeon RBG_13_52_12]
MDLLSRFRGSLLGLAVGDALGAPVEFEPRGSFAPITGLRGGGPFNLRAGDWTDDTSLALCLAESLVERRGFDPRDQAERYVRWWKEDHLSCTGNCFDIGNTTKVSLQRFMDTGNPYSGPTNPETGSNGSLMRLAPVPLFYHTHPREAVEYSGLSSKTTHGALVAVDSCRYLGGLIIGALNGIKKESLLASRYEPAVGIWSKTPLTPEVDTVALGSFKRSEPPVIKAQGTAVKTLEAALWAFGKSRSFEEGCLLAVNLGDDSDTVGAVYGQLAGTYYGVESIPTRWRNELSKTDVIENMAEKLFNASQHFK